LFSEKYFYLIAFGEEEETKENELTIYRIDCIESLKALDDKFYISYIDRIEAGEFRKKIQEIFGKKKGIVTFDYCGPDVDVILD
jgi:hypothetical protein